MITPREGLSLSASTAPKGLTPIRRECFFSINGHLPKFGVNFVSTLAETRRFTRIDGEEVFVISKSPRWSYGLPKDLRRVGFFPFKIQYP
jgi:hypothetical protein